MSDGWYKVLDDPEIWKPFFPHVFWVKNKKIVLIKGASQWFAFNDACPHNSASLSRGMCHTDHSITCPLHRYRFSLINGKTISGSACALNLYALEIRHNSIYVFIS